MVVCGVAGTCASAHSPQPTCSVKDWSAQHRGHDHFGQTSINREEKRPNLNRAIHGPLAPNLVDDDEFIQVLGNLSHSAR